MATSTHMVTLLALALSFSLLTTGCWNKTGGGNQSTAPTQTEQASAKAGVAMLDPDVIYKSPEYDEANKKLQAKAKSLQEAFDAKAKSGKAKPGEMEMERLKMQQQMEKERATLLNPLNDRVSKVIALYAKQHNYDVVLDKRIVVLGVPDVTNDIKDMFGKEKDPKVTDEEAKGTSDKSGVGYVNQETISDLKMFHDAEGDLVKYYQQLGKEYQAWSVRKKPGPVEKGQMEQQMASRFQAKKEALYAPMQGKVNDVIQQVAKAQNLSLVLDTRQVMWGGHNITSDVIKQLVTTGEKPKS